jgi:hypothetical protein
MSFILFPSIYPEVSVGCLARQIMPRGKEGDNDDSKEHKSKGRTLFVVYV